MSAVVAADTYAGCCVADAINAAKVTCGLTPRASCSTIFSTPTAPSNECAYLNDLSDSLNPLYLPSVDSGCVNAFVALITASMRPQYINPDIKYYQSVCNSTCQSFYNLYSSCFSTQQADSLFRPYCGSYNGMYCPVLTNSTAYTNAASTLTSSCNDIACTTTCKSALVPFEALGGCCAASDFNNALNVACGLNTVAPCTAIFSAAQQL